VLVAPTELRHNAFRQLTRNGKGSNTPETWGCDFGFYHKTPNGMVKYGIQRKELKDFVASVNDGRLAKEVQQMCVLEQGVLVIEGSPRWDLNGNLVADKWGAGWTQRQHISMLLSVQDEGVWVLGTNDTSATAEVCRDFERWVKKGLHTALKKRGPVVSPWGKRENRDYQRHLVMGLPGVDVTLADRIIDTIGMPFVLGVSEAQLRGIEGLGPKKVRAIMEALR
jgi:ERCC4-type nuclease